MDDRAALEAWLRRDAAVHLYELGDLDDFFWPHTRYFGLEDERGEVSAVALVYAATELPVLLALAPPGSPELRALVGAILPDLPARLYAHVSPRLEDALARRYDAESHGEHLKMALRDTNALRAVDTRGVERLGPADLDEVLAFYRKSYEGNWFDPRMLQTGQYFGTREDGALVVVAGVHVYSPAQRVAALGNVATDPERRGRGLARRVTARLCASLLEEVEHVGLNVKADNAAAIACYRRLGFEEVARYEELMLTERPRAERA